MASGTATKDFKDIIIDSLTVLMKADQIKKDRFKALAYQKVIKELQAHEGPIRSSEDLEGIKGIGAKIKAKIDEIFETGGLKAAAEAAAVVPISVYDDLLKIHGVGPVKAKKLVEGEEVKSIADLRAKAAANPKLLDKAQTIGLKHYEDFNERIPRQEMDQHAAALEAATSTTKAQMKIEIVGSYRRGLQSSGDIDCLVNFPRLRSEKSVLEEFAAYVADLQERNYITDILALGPHKCMAVCTIDGTKFRRLDLLVTPNDEWAYAILYFTGSDRFNVAMRSYALEQGWSLNEKGLTATTGAADKPQAKTAPASRGALSHNFVVAKTEKDIFKFLGLKYIEPTERTGADKIIPE